MQGSVIFNNIGMQSIAIPACLKCSHASEDVGGRFILELLNYDFFCLSENSLEK